MLISTTCKENLKIPHIKNVQDNTTLLFCIKSVDEHQEYVGKKPQNIQETSKANNLALETTKNSRNIEGE